MEISDKLEEIKSEVRALIYKELGFTVFVDNTTENPGPLPGFGNWNFLIDHINQEIIKRLEKNELCATNFDIIVKLGCKMVVPWRMGFFLRLIITEKEPPQNA